jgi:anti-sigma regulatory factor (Ser/Thr protein kinase)
MIRITLAHAENSLILEIEDRGLPFNPVSAPAMVAVSELAQAPIGGRGVHLIKHYADALQYDYVCGVNRLKLIVLQPWRPSL